MLVRGFDRAAAVVTNTSATGGYLSPDGVLPDPLEDDALDDFMGDVVAGITGLDRDANVRPRWQKEPPDLPAYGTDWCAVGVPERLRDTYPAIVHGDTLAGGQGADRLTRHEQLKVMASFYGPNCQKLAGYWADGLMVAQNREALDVAGFKLKEVGPPTKAPEILKNQWTPRCDVEAWFSRQIDREYAILNLKSAPMTIQTDAITDAINPATP